MFGSGPSLRRARGLAALTLCASLGLGLSCGDPEDPGEDPEAVLATSVAFASELERLDIDLVPSQHLDSMSTAAIWATPEAAELFRTLDPADIDQKATFPRGSILVKDVHDIDGMPLDVLTVLAKFEPGYYPAGKDWYFAAIRRDGTIIDNTAGNGPEVKFCVDCHSMIGSNTDLVIGLPADQLR
ncbi:MAG: hypothetical protein KC457_22415 [Myxococcales bacterium]|nr:hypothetical protein [Myxococcales bacterium]